MTAGTIYQAVRNSVIEIPLDKSRNAFLDHKANEKKILKQF